MHEQSHQLIGIFLAATIWSAPAFATPEIVELGTSGAHDAIVACGDLAAHPLEAGRDGRGVTDAQIFIDGAIDACSAALAAAPDSANAKTWLARAYILAGRRDAAKTLLEEAIVAGNPFAAYLLANLLGRDLDRAGPEDPGRAVKLLTLAADGGFLPAQADLAERYELGDGVAVNAAEALRLYERASAARYGRATYKLGTFYQHGIAVAQDLEQARALYETAAAEGEPLGHTGLGRMHEFGEGVAQDLAEAVRYYRLAAESHEKTALTALAYFYEQGIVVEQDFDESFRLLTDAAGQQWGFAQAALAIHYLSGQGTPVDYGQALDLAWAATRQQVTYAEGILGFMYEQGLGTARHLGAAQFHFQAGADGGDAYSVSQLPVIELELAYMDAAGGPYEPGVMHGVAFAAIDAESAIPACEEAVEANPVTGNMAWLARAYVSAQRYDEALPLLDEASADGNLLAQTVLGDMLMNGWGIERDAAGAVDLYRQAAGDYAAAQYALGLAYRDGTGVAEDREEALKWLRLAESFGMSEASAALAALRNEAAPAAVDLTGFGREGPGY